MSKKTIPTFIGIFLILIGALAGVVIVKGGTNFLPRAAPEYIPQKIKVTNISDTGFTISWITQEPTIGFIKIGPSPEKIDTTVVDERDQLTGDSGQYRTHYISVLGLEPNTTYFLKLGSHSKRLYDNEGEALTVSTGTPLNPVPPADTAYGTVMTSAGTPAENAIVYITIGESNNATPLSTLVKQNGNWALSLSTARTTDLNGYAVYDPQQSPLNILVRASLTDEAVALTTTQNDQPVPEITLGESEDFRTPVDGQLPPPPETTPTPPAESKFSLLPLQVTEPEAETTIKISSPATDNAQVNESQPQIVGSAPPGTVLTVTIHSSQIYTDTVYTDETGSWSWVPPGKLEPGTHIVTISYSDDQGLLHSLNRTFVVASAQAVAAGSPVYSASPSATLSPTPQPTLVPTRAPTTNPTLMPSLKPTIVPTAVPTSMPTEPPDIASLPPAGQLSPTILLIGMGVILLMGGTLLLIK